MSNIVHLIRPDLRNVKPYSSARREASMGRIWLNANELPWDEYGMPEAKGLNRYPDQQPEALTHMLAATYEVDQDQLLITRGSDDAIDFLVRLFCEAQKDSVLICPPTFGMYEISAQLQGAGIVQVPLMSKDFSLDYDRILSSWNPNIKIIFLCSPNNPTGNLMEARLILRLCEELDGKSIIVVDEAYVEFSKSQSFSNYLNTFSNLLVLRTLSKAFGLAALRIGVLLSNQEIIAWVKKILPPYPISLLSSKVATRALNLRNRRGLSRKIDLLIKERDRVFMALKKSEVVEQVWESQSNFIFVKFNRPLYTEFLSRGIVVRDMETTTGIANSVRITLGTETENSALIKALGE